jgi:hypothetical protein
MAERPVESHFEVLIDVNRRAFAAGQYEVAYHALMAALHAAQDRQAADQLEQVAELAQMQQETIDVSSPGHPLASAQAREHGGNGIYGMASRQASTQALIARRREGVS